VKSYDASAGQHTFIFADLAGFTALTEAHGDEQAADLATDFCRRMRESAPQFGGEVIKAIGDAVMIRCERAESAIELALTILDEEDARAEFPGVRVGMHSGTAIGREGDWFGASVNVAARVSAVAGGGEIVVTQATVDLAGELDEVELQRLGSREFKNVSGSVSLYSAFRRGAHRGSAEIDPVCRMTIAEGGGIGSLNFEGKVFHFCSMGCAQLFTASPEQYAPGR